MENLEILGVQELQKKECQQIQGGGLFGGLLIGLAVGIIIGLLTS
ncbi:MULTISPECIES: hypothetical protein [unclassified Flagellimonas]|nr:MULTISPECIES: hypothetical protein [unclassified Flagellimonas]